MTNYNKNKLIIEQMRRIWNKRGKENNPIKAAHFVIVKQGKETGLISESVWDETAREIAERLDLKKEDSLLEVGCGSGLLLERLKNKVSFCAGVDISEEMLKHIKDENIELRVAEASKLPFEDEKFSKVFCHSVFHYFPDIEYAKQSINEMLRVCKQDGTILISDVLNGYLDDIRLKEEASNTGLYFRIVRQFKNVLRPLYYQLKRKPIIEIKPLSIEPTFFKKYFKNTNHKVFPLLETVESKPAQFLIFRYDILIQKNAKRKKYKN